MKPLSLQTSLLWALFWGFTLGWFGVSLGLNLLKSFFRRRWTPPTQKFATLNRNAVESGETSGSETEIRDQKTHGVPVFNIQDLDWKNLENEKRPERSEIHRRGQVQANEENSRLHEWSAASTDQSRSHPETETVQIENAGEASTVLRSDFIHGQAAHRANSEHEKGTVRRRFDSETHTTSRLGANWGNARIEPIPDGLHRGEKLYEEGETGRD